MPAPLNPIEYEPGPDSRDDADLQEPAPEYGDGYETADDAAPDDGQPDGDAGRGSGDPVQTMKKLSLIIRIIAWAAPACSGCLVAIVILVLIIFMAWCGSNKLECASTIGTAAYDVIFGSIFGS